MSFLDMPVRKTIHLYPNTVIDDWSDIVAIVVEGHPTEQMRNIIYEANRRKIVVKGATDEVVKYLSVMFTGA